MRKTIESDSRDFRTLDYFDELFLWLLAYDPAVNVTLNADSGKYTAKPSYYPVDNILERCF